MEQVTKYFNAEKYESVFFILIGLTAIIVSGYFLLIVKQPFYNGLSYSLMVVAFIQLVVGTTVYLRCSKDIERVQMQINSERSKIAEEEIPRMKVVMRNFEIYKYVEILLIVVGIFFFGFLDSDLLKGIGLGLVLQSTIMLILDFIAAARGADYLGCLKQII